MPLTQTQTRTHERVQSWNRHDPETFAAFYGKDATVQDPMHPEPLRGRDAIRQDFEEFMTAFPDTNFTVGAVVESGDTVAFEVIARGTHNGPLPGPEGPIPATNRRIEMPVAAFARLDEQGLVAEERRYFDVAGLMQQLGLLSE